MSLLTSFPHTIDVDQPSYTQAAESRGNVITWVSVATGVPCQVTSSGGSVGDTFGGDKRTETKTLSLTRAVVQHGYRVTWEGGKYVVTGGVGKVTGIGSIPTFYTWELTRETAGA